MQEDHSNVPYRQIRLGQLVWQIRGRRCVQWRKIFWRHMLRVVTITPAAMAAEACFGAATQDTRDSLASVTKAWANSTIPHNPHCQNIWGFPNRILVHQMQCTQNVECATMDISHAQETPHWWCSGSGVMALSDKMLSVYHPFSICC